MFVSSYNTYIGTNSSDKTNNKRIAENSKSASSSFKSELEKDTVLESKNIQNLPVNYISNYKSYSNKQKLQNQEQFQDVAKYTKSKAIENAGVAYKDNSKMFSLFIEPKATQNQIPQIDKKLPNEIQELQKQNMRYKMVNTYLSNDKYYQITA